MFKIHPVPAFKDNYIWVIHTHDAAIVVDPGAASPVIEYLQLEELQLSAILITHHHHDHTGGIIELLQYSNAPVYGPHSESIANITRPLLENDKIRIPEIPLELSVLEIPGHTLDHIAYYGSEPFNMLFCGDTLFACGCGRVFEGTMQQMYQSLQKLSQLPDDTLVYCTHEYTLSNIQFAQTVDTNNAELLEFLTIAQALRKQNKPTLPTTIGSEKMINPFLRCTQPAIITSVQSYAREMLSKPDDIFSALRDWKNNY